MKKDYNPKLLSGLIDSFTKSLGIKTKLEQYSIFDVWCEIVGEQIAKVTEIERIDNGMLIVRVSNAPWRTELTFRKKEILAKIYERMNTTAIRDIRFR